jgi:small multidrug resistance pump
VSVWLVLAVAIAVEVFATLGMRASEGFRKKAWTAPVIVAYLASFYLLWLVLKLGMPIGIAYGVWTACGVALVAVIARYVFKDPLTLKMIAGIGFIVAGVLVIELAGAVH